jgi:DNA-binding NarL/FixJ family response regulator
MRIALCCKEPLFCEALGSLLSHEGNFDVVARESQPRACITAAKEQRAQIIVVDADGLAPNEIEFFMGARAYGDFGICMIANEESASHLDGHNLDAVLSRRSAGSSLFKAIRDVGASFIRIPSGRMRESRSSYTSGFELTRREYEVASLVAKGFSNRRIAAVTGLREQSIKNLVSVVMRKLKCENRVQVALRLAAANANVGAAPQGNTED